MRAVLVPTVLAALALTSCGGGDDGGGRKGGASAGLSVEDAARLVRLQNRGIGLLERYDYGQAAAVLEEAHALAPDWNVGRLHLAMAYLHAGAETRPKARQMVEDLLKETPDDVRALFTAGILAENAGDTEAALPHFRRAYELSGDAVIGAKLGTLLVALDLEDEAFTVLTEVHARRPALVSPVNALMLLHRRRGDEAAAQEFYDKLVALKGEINDERRWVKVGEEIRDAYGNLGPYSLAVRDFADPGSGAARPDGDIAAGWKDLPVRAGSPPPGAPAYLGMAALDYDTDGDLDLFLCGGDAPAALLRNDGGLAFTDVAAEAGVAITGAYAVTAGDIDVDPKVAAAASGGAPSLPDLVVAVAGGLRVLRNTGKGAFEDVTEAAGLAADPGGARAVLLLDADQEGDLDLFVAGGAAGGNRLYANRGPGVFVDVTADSGLAGDGKPYGPAVVLDADEDWDLDLLVTRPDGPPVLFLNDRMLRFHAVEGWVPAATDGSHGAITSDFDADGHEDVVVCGESGATWLRGTGTGFAAQALTGAAQGGPAVHVDAHLRGLRDLYLPVGSRLLPYVDGSDDFEIEELEPQAAPLSNPLAADLDGDGAEEIVLHAPGAAPRVITLTAKGRGTGLVLDFRGVVRNDVQAGWSNLEGRDAWVEVKAGPFWQGRRVGAVSGFGASNPTRSVFGIGDAMQADFVRVAWPDAVQQGVLDVPAGAPVLIVEEQRRPDSCPLLFSWDGHRFAWVTDFIGAGGLGFLIAPGVYADPDPTESVKVPADLVAPDAEGRLAFKLVEAMEEIVYLDHTDLLVVDHPEDVHVDPDERFTGERPFADGHLLAHRERIVPAAARDGRGRNVLPHVLATDRIYSEDPDLHPRLTGAIDESVLELDFGDGLADVAPGDPLVLYLDGWIEYGYTRTSVAAAGEGFEYVVPALDVWDEASGAWRLAAANLGYPAGFPRVMTYDVTGVLSRETPRVRIRTNLEIYWDRVWLGRRIDAEESTRTTVLQPVVADLRWVGYPREHSPDGRHPRIYDYGTLDPAMPWKTVEGDYTRFGDVRPLLLAAEDHYVIYGKGEEIDVRFDPSALPELPDGWTRTYVLRFTGWCKGQELYIAHGFTVEPLPFLGMSGYPYGDDEAYPDTPESRTYRETWNTRRIGPPKR